MEAPAFIANIAAPRPAWINSLARFGLAAIGLVYCLVGTLAFMAAFEIGGRTTQGAGKTGTFSFLLEQPFGKFLLLLLAAGLFCYTLWRLIQAIADTEQKGTGAKGIARRLGYAFSGLVYGTFAFTATKLALGNGSNSNGNFRQDLAAQLLNQPFGQVLLGLVGTGTIGLGLYQIYRALSGKYLKKIKAGAFDSQAKEFLCRAGKIGYIARGTVWVIIGYLLLQAAFTENAGEAGGTEKVFAFLEKGIYGSLLLGAMALGLLAYGLFMFVRAKYERIRT